MSSIESLQNDHQQRLADELQLSAGVNRLGRMSALRSTHRNLLNEDESIRRNIEAHERQMFGEDLPEARPPMEGDDMDIMAARDVYINHKPPDASPPVTQPAPVAAQAAVPVAVAAPAPAPMSMAAKAGLLATALAVGAGPPAAVATYYAMRQQPQIERPDNVGGVRLLPPEERAKE